MHPSIRWTGLAIAVASGAASAQSGVILAGRIDVGPQYINDGSHVQRRVDSGAYTASRLVIRGTEDLGSGLSALFYLENRFNADTGTPQSSAKFFNAGASVGLSSTTWGTLIAGRQYVPMFYSFLWSDDTGPLRLHNYSAVQSIQRSNFARISATASPVKAAGSLDTLAGGVYALGITSAFEDNLVVYKSPVIAGATLSLAAGAPEGYAAGNGKVYSADLEYRKGDFYGSVAYNQKRGALPAGSGAVDQKLTEGLVASMYAVTKSFKLWGNYHPWTFDSAASELKGRDWMLGASYWFPQAELWVNYASKKLDNCTACNSSGFGVGAHYFLSKRTELYASVARVLNAANSGNTLNGFTPGTLGQNVRGVAVGVAHVF